MISEIKLDDSFPLGRFYIDGQFSISLQCLPIRLDHDEHSG